LLQAATDSDTNNINVLKEYIQDGEEGDMWLVKSAIVSIQARYKRDESIPERNLFVRSVAIGGSFMGGNKLIVGPLDEAITYNGEEILKTQVSQFNVEGVVHARRHSDSRLVQDAAIENPGVDMELPDGVKLLFNRQAHYINVKVQMPPVKSGQDGLCGNFNGAADDDSLEMIEDRDPRVAVGESLV
jgi:hypothetical protein